MLQEHSGKQSLSLIIHLVKKKKINSLEFLNFPACLLVLILYDQEKGS